MRSRLTIFLCSTRRDLVEERDAALDAIRRLQLQHDSMEFFGARPDQPIETCLAEVRRSNILVVIVGHSYGTLVQELGVSYSEAEYEEGFRLKKPCLVYLRGEDVPVLPVHMERDPKKIELLEKWKATLRERHTVAYYQDISQLAVQVTADLSRIINDMDDATFLRGKSLAESTTSVLEELAPIITEAKEAGVTEVVLLGTLRRAVSALVAKGKQLPSRVLLSYSQSDHEVVMQFQDYLEEAGVRNISYAVDDSRFSNMLWFNMMNSGLDVADAVVLFISPSFVQFPLASKRLQVVWDRLLSGEPSAIIVPILLEHTDFPPLLRSFQLIDMTDRNFDKAVKRFLDGVRSHALSQNRFGYES